MSFDKLKKNRAASISKLVETASAINTPKNNSDDRFWSPTVDKAGNGYAVIRFLPAPGDDALPWVRYWDHGFQGPTGRWYIEKSLTSIGKQDPVSESNRKLWDSGLESDKEIVRSRKRRLHHVSNILVVSDSTNPENEGKVFLYKYGKKIFDKVNEAMQPQFEDEKPINPFDFWSGANFKLKIRNVDGYRSYDKSEFDSPSELYGGDEDRLKSLYENDLNSLEEFTDPTEYKTYEELASRLVMVLGETTDEPVMEAAPVAEAPAPVSKTEADPIAKVDDDDDVPFGSTGGDDDDDDLSMFAKLANQE